MANVVKYNELHRIVMTCIIYNDEGRYLVTKRSPNEKAYPSKWTVPGGGLEPSDYVDTPKTTADAWYNVVERTIRREVKEEVNIDIEKPEYLLDLVFIRPDNIPVLILSYYAKYKSGEVVLNKDDMTEYKWITVEEGKEIDLIPGILEEIETTDKILKSK